MKKAKDILLNAKNIAVVRTDRLGDMVLTLPMCSVLKKINPAVKIHLICRSYVAPIVENISDIDEIHYLEQNHSDIQVIFRKNKFDAVIFPRPRFDEFYAAFKTNVKLRVGSAYRLYSFLLNQKVKDHRKDGDFHELEYNIRLISDITGEDYTPKLIRPHINPSRLDRMKALLNKFEIKSPITVLHPGSGGSSKNWSADKFAELAEMLEKQGVSVLITGIKSEKELCDKVQNSNPKAINLCGLLDLEETMAMISLSDVLVANSTGILHIAAALGINVIGLYPNTNSLSAKRWGPYSPKALTISPKIKPESDQDDLNRIHVSDVFDLTMKSIKLS